MKESAFLMGRIEDNRKSREAHDRQMRLNMFKIMDNQRR